MVDSLCLNDCQRDIITEQEQIVRLLRLSTVSHVIFIDGNATIGEIIFHQDFIHVLPAFKNDRSDIAELCSLFIFLLLRVDSNWHNKSPSVTDT